MDNYNQEVVLLCENSTEGILSAVYDAYRKGLNHNTTYIETGTDTYRLFARYEKVETNPRKVNSVLKTLHQEFREEDMVWLEYALASREEDIGQAVYRTICAGRYQIRRKGKDCGLFDNLKDPYIHKTFSMARTTVNELHHFREFLRFEEMEDGILFAKIVPKCNILSFLSRHFADRFPMENFVIYDESIDLYSVHPAGKNWYLVHGNGEENSLRQSEREQDYQELFRHFCHKISIKERENLKLQTSMLPLRFRKYMPEFDKK